MDAASPAPAAHPAVLSWQRTRVQGRVAAYVEAGAGRTVVFLHGWGLGHRAYRGSVHALAAAGVHVFAPALPGFSGTAALPTPDCSLGDYAAWVLDFLDAVELDRPVLLVGHSFGGGVATMAALERPDRVGGLVLVNSIGGAAWTPDGELVGPVARRLWEFGAHFGRDVRAPARLVRVLPITLAEVIPNLVRAPRSFLRTARLAAGSDLTTELETLRRRGMPVVVVWGRRDQVITDRAFHALCDALGDPASITVRGGHNWLLADPAHFGEVMTNVVSVAESARWLRRAGRLRRWWRRSLARRRRVIAER